MRFKTLLLFGLCFALTALSPLNSPAQQIVAYQYYFDNDPGVGVQGNGFVGNIAPVDQFNNPLSISLPAGLSNGFHNLYMRVKFNTGVWSIAERKGFLIQQVNSAPNINIVAYQYFFDTDPGVGVQGNGAIVNIPSTANFNNTVPIILPNTLSNGFHSLYIRVKDEFGKWSIIERKNFIISLPAVVPPNLNALEYFFDNDPGVGNGTLYPINPTPNFNSTIILPVPCLPVGAHKLFVRAKDIAGSWSLSERASFTVDPGIVPSIVSPSGPLSFCIQDAIPLSTNTVPGIGYQWLKDGNPIPGATLSTYLPQQTGIYTLRSTCGLFSANSNGVLVTVLPTVTAGIISGAANLCLGQTDTYSSNGTIGGSWSSTNTAVATVNSFSGQVTTTGVGTTNIIYTINSGCGSPTLSSKALQVHPNSNAGVIIGDGEICVSHVTNYISTGETGGIWESTNPAVLSINSVTGSTVALSEGTTTIKYSVGIACPDVATRNVVVTGTPQIIAHPAGLTKCAGESALFSVSATGFNLTYQWRRNSQSLPGQISSTCIIGTLGLADAGTYDVVIDNGCNSITTSGAILTVHSAPEIIVQPASSSVCLGQPLQLSVTASGDGLTYQWFKNGSVLLGQTSNNLDIPSVNLGDAGEYHVVINGICSPEAESLVATVAVNEAPVFQGSLPPTIFRCPGDNFSLSGVATGSNISYQWFKNNVPIQGATNLLFEINGLVPTNSGTYSLVATNTCGEITSNPCVLFVPQPPVIITQPVAQTFCPGQTVTLSVIATGDGLTYDWRKNGISVSGGTNSSYQTNETGNYSVVISGPCAQIESDIVVALEIIPPFIFQNPLSHSVCLGNVTAFTAVAGNNFSGIQWMKDGIDIPGETNSLLLINPVTPVHAGTYRLKVFWACNPPVLSQPAVLSINEAVVIQQPPVDQTRCIGEVVEFSVGATGTGLTYQWFKGNSLINGATNSTLSLGFANPSMAGTYKVSIGGTCQPSNILLSANLTVNESPLIITQPSSRSTCVGSPVTFTVVASGTNLQYQWQKGMANIIGATGSSYSINAATLGDIGSYRVIISGDCSGPITSNIVTLSIGDPPLITSQPVSQAKCIGQPVTFSVGASGNNLSYQWRKGGIDIVGATGSSYTIISVGTGDAASYAVSVDNGCGGPVISNSALLTVNPNVSAGTISGMGIGNRLCVSQTGMFFTTGTPGGRWFSGNSNILSINLFTGVATTLMPGEVTISYQVLSGCGSPSVSTANVIVNPGIDITVTGPSSICSNKTITYTAIIQNVPNPFSITHSQLGEWSVSDPTIASITINPVINVTSGNSSLGTLVTTVDVIGLRAGSFLLTYTGLTGCNLGFLPSLINVNSSPDPGIISGPALLCEGALVDYFQVSSGNGNGNNNGGPNGVWSSSNPTIISIQPNGNRVRVSARAPGVAELIYSVSNQNCTSQVRKTITINYAGEVICPTGNFTRNANTNCQYVINGGEFNPLGVIVYCVAGQVTIKYTLSGATTGSGSYIQGQNSISLSGVLLNKGITTIKWEKVVQNASTYSCSFTVTVNDNSPPGLSCPSNITATANNNSCSRQINTPRPSLSDNCTPDRDMTLTWKIERNGQIIALSPFTGLNYVGTRSFGGGVSKITYTATDEAGNSKSCSFTVTVTGGFCLPRGIVEEETVETIGFTVFIAPNPTENNFRLSVESDSHDQVAINVYDVSGRKVEQMKGSPYNPFVFGYKLIPGIYMAEITQGKYRKLIKLIKQ